MTDATITPPVRANVPPPPHKQLRGLQAIVHPTPEVEAPPANMQRPNAGVQDLNFKVDPDFHLAFKMTATTKKMTMKELLEASFRCWLEKYGDAKLRALLPDV